MKLRLSNLGLLSLLELQRFFFKTYFVRQDFLQSFSTQTTGFQLFSGLLCGLTLHQSFCLGQEVSQQDLQPNQTLLYSDIVISPARC